MEIFLYSIFDRVAGTYSEPFAALKDELAIRRFVYFMQNSPMVAQDCDLFKVAGMSMDTGLILPVSEDCKPVFVYRYEVRPNE